MIRWLAYWRRAWLRFFFHDDTDQQIVRQLAFFRPTSALTLQRRAGHK
jgi:hypothetical protein